MREPSDAELLTAIWQPANPFLPWAFLAPEAKLRPWENSARVPLVDEVTDAQQHIWKLAGIAARVPFSIRTGVEWHRALLWARLAEFHQMWWTLPEDVEEMRRRRFADIWGTAALVHDLALTLKFSVL